MSVKRALPSPVDEEERAALLGADGAINGTGGAAQAAHPSGMASVSGSVFNLANTTVGAGVLTLPYALSKTGMAVGIGMLLLVAFVAASGHRLLVQAAARSDKFTYKEVAQDAFGPRAAILVDLMVLFYTFGTLVAYPIILGNQIPVVMEEFLNDDDNLLTDDVFVMCILMFVVIFPLSAMPNLAPLRYFSAAALVCVVYVVGLVVVYFADGTEESKNDDIVWFNADVDLFFAFPLLSVSFTAHYNVLRVYYELKERSIGLMDRVIRLAVMFILSLYLVIGIVGYLNYRSSVEDDILLNLPDDAVAANIARLALSMTIIFSYPLVLFATRASLDNLLFPNGTTFPFKRIVLTLALVGLSLLLAILLPGIKTVFSFSGSTAGVGIVYIMPALIHLKKTNEDGPATWLRASNALALSVLTFGVVFGTLGFVTAVINVA